MAQSEDYKVFILLYMYLPFAITRHYNGNKDNIKVVV